MVLPIGEIVHGNCLDVLKTFPENSIDLIVTDPPYGLALHKANSIGGSQISKKKSMKGGFMGHSWDAEVPTADIWKECLRVLKAGAFAFVMCAPRQDSLAKMIVNLDEAGFQTNFSSIYWAYASGFPKALNISGAIERRIDSIKKKLYDCEELWKKELNSVKYVEKIFLRDIIAIGLLTTAKEFVVPNVEDFYKAKKWNVDVTIAEKSLSEALLMQKENIYFVPENADINMEQPLSNVHIVELKLESQNLRSLAKIVFVPINVHHFLCERISKKIKEGLIGETESGEEKFSKEININALGVEIINDLKLTTLNQLKNSLNLDMKSRTELLSATNVIITKSIKECLTLSTANIVGRSQNQIHLSNIGEAGYQAEWNVTVPCTNVAKELDGAYAGFQPKPAVEVIIVVMKPISEKTFVDQAMKDKKGVTWLADGKIPAEVECGWAKTGGGGKGYLGTNTFKVRDRTAEEITERCATGRFPANLIVSDDVLDDGEVHRKRGVDGESQGGGGMFGYPKCLNSFGDGDEGSFSHFFDIDRWWEEQIKTLGIQEVFPFLIVPKADKGEKDKGCKDLPKKKVLPYTKGGFANPKSEETEVAPRANIHPTVKPIKLMSYLVTLGSRKGDVVLDPFVGSGTTCFAAKLLERQYIGIDITEEYVEIARTKLSYLGKIGVANTFF